MEVLRALGLAVYALAGALGAGSLTLRTLRLDRQRFEDRLEAVSVAGATGFGVLGLALTLLGLAGVLYPQAVLGLVALSAVAGAVPAWWLLATKRARGTTDKIPIGATQWVWWAVCVALAVLASAALVQDLAPPADYDGLLYHLVTPQTYLAAHRIVYIPHNFSANLPAFGEMLYTIGLAGGSDRAPQLVHGLTAVLCCGLTLALGRRALGRTVAWGGTAALAATPLVPFLATRAYIDLFTLLFALLGCYALWRWRELPETAWLILAGAACGWAISTKYAALTLLAALGLALLVDAWGRAGPASTRLARLAGTALPGVTLGAAAVVTAGPWVARQMVTLGNPVWPMYFGGRDWDAVRVAQLTYFVEQYGTGKSLRDTVLLPLHVYLDSWRFGHVPSAYPPLIAPLAPLALRLRRGAVLWLGGISLALCGLWVRGWQDLRFLLPAYPLLALLGAAGLLSACRWLRLGRLSELVVALASLAGTLLALVYVIPATVDALPVTFGTEPETTYLERKLPDLRAIERLNQAGAGATALMLGDGQIWYCRARCIPDAAHDNLLTWFERPGSPDAALALLKHEGVTHVLLSKRDYWYLEHQDPKSLLKKQLADFYVFKAAHLELVYEDELTELYRGRW